MRWIGRALLVTGEGVVTALLDWLDRVTGYRRDSEAQVRARYARERDADTWGRD